jgi:hypothetical protein
MTIIITAFERSPDGDQRLARGRRAYQRAFEAQRAVNTRQLPVGG